MLMRARVRTEPCSPRLLVLKIDGRSINLTVIVAHAPPKVSGEQGRKSFWSSLRKAAKAVPRASLLALLIDANGRVGIPKSRFIGSCPGDVENANGSELRRVLEERNLHAVSTFTPVYQPTWWSGRAQHRGRRIDYVVVSSDWTDDAAKLATLLAIQLPGESVDHVPDRASMLWPHFSSGDQKSTSRMHDSLALDPWLINCPDARSWFQHCTSACIPTLLSLAQRGLVDDMYSVAHSALHRCATSCFGAQKSAPKPRKPWMSQRTVAMNVWTGPARHQLHRFRKVLKLVNAKCIMLAFRNAIGQIAPGRVLDALRVLTMRIQRSAMKRAITDDLQAWLGKLTGEANNAAAKGDMGHVFAIAKKLKSGHDRPHRVIRDEDGVLLVDEDQVTPRWRRHWAELLHGQETRWSELANVASEYAIQHTGRKRMDLLTLHDV